MPLYAFRCTTCCHQFDRLLSLRDDEDGVRCPECGAPVQRLMSAFAVTSPRGGGVSRSVPGGG